MVERREVLEYIEERIQQLKKEGHRVLLEIEESKRENIRQRFKGRVRELERIKEILHNNEFERELRKLKETGSDG